MNRQIILLFLCILFSSCSDIQVTQLDPKDQAKRDASVTTPGGSDPGSPSNPAPPNRTTPGGPSGSGTIDLNTDPITGNHQGTVLVPRPGAKTVSGIATDIADAAVSGSCPNIPNGYQSLPYTLVELLDSSGATLASTTTTICGEFGLDIPTNATQIRYYNVNCQILSQDITAIAVNTIDANKISMVTLDSGIAIDAIHRLDNHHLALSIKDLITDKAILGFDQQFFEIRVNGILISIVDISYASFYSTASVGLSLDLSGSMSSSVDSTNNPKHQIVGLAGHRFIDLKSTLDEVSFNIFSSNVDNIDDSFVSSLNLFSGANPLQIPYSSSGFMTDPILSRFALDLYNPSSVLHGGGEPLHADLISKYGPIQLPGYSSPWHGGTALFDGIGKSLEKTALRANNRKFIIALTNGYENSSSSYTTSQQVIDKAKALNIPVFTLGFGSDSQIDKPVLKDIANQTGGTFKQIQSIADVASAFEGIQTNIRFEYVIETHIAIQSGDSIEISIGFAESTVSQTQSLP